MLLTDSDVATTEIISTLDPETMVVADALAKGRFLLPLSGPNSVCQRAWVECRSKLEAALATFTTYFGTTASQSHLAALNNTGGWYGTGTRARLRLSQIVVHDTYYSNSLSPIQQWVGYTALRILFQSAAFHFAAAKTSNTDRYEQKSEHYCKQEARLWGQVLAQGLPYVFSYFSCPGAIHDYQTGTWGASNLSNTVDVDNTNPVDQSIRIAITYYDNTNYVSPVNKNNSESGPSAILDYDLPAGQLLTIDITSLNPPNIDVPPPTGVSQGVAPYMNASHWQIYIGSSDPNAPLYLQVSGIPIATKVHTLPATFSVNTAVLGPGQTPQAASNLDFGNLITRG
jgi:hypothetical protein